MEVSCQQGENLKEFKPHIGLITNLTEAHIDFMKTYEHYKKVKAKNVFTIKVKMILLFLILKMKMFWMLLEILNLLLNIFLVKMK